MASPVVTSLVKRDKLKKEAKLKISQEMRAALPVLNREEVRRCRLPYHEAVLLELDEQGFSSSAEYLRQLIRYQEELRELRGPDSVIATKPRLIETRSLIDTLYKSLRNAEAAHYVDDIETECDELIQVGVTYGLGSDDWWWLGEQLLIQAVNVSSGYQKDGGEKEALSKYIYGKFLLENNAEQAKLVLTEARQLSTGQKWTAKRELDHIQKQETVFIESCILLYKALLAEAKLVMKIDPLKVARICMIAKKRANDACDHKGEAEALMLQGLCELDAGDAKAAVISFMKVIILYTKIDDPNDICEARIHLALAYLKIGNMQETLKQLNLLLEFAEERNLPYYIAQAYRFLGEVYLNQSSPSSATPLLIRALNTFHELQDLLNREQARNLAAISAGQELIPKYVELILKCGRSSTGQEHVMKLVRWKNTRELFWSEEIEAVSESVKQSSTHSSITYSMPKEDEEEEEREEPEDEKREEPEGEKSEEPEDEEKEETEVEEKEEPEGEKREELQANVEEAHDIDIEETEKKHHN